MRDDRSRLCDVLSFALYGALAVLLLCIAMQGAGKTVTAALADELFHTALYAFCGFVSLWFALENALGAVRALKSLR